MPLIRVRIRSRTSSSINVNPSKSQWFENLWVGRKTKDVWENKLVLRGLLTLPFWFSKLTYNVC